MLKLGSIYAATAECYQHFIFQPSNNPINSIGVCANKTSRCGRFQHPHRTTFIKTYT